MGLMQANEGADFGAYAAPHSLHTVHALAALETLDDLPHTSASDLKKLGWRSVAQQVRQAGTVVVTNHRQYDAVILSIEAYTAIQQALARASEQAQPALDALRARFDARMAGLHATDAASRLHALMDAPARLHGEVKVAGVQVPAQTHAQ